MAKLNHVKHILFLLLCNLCTLCGYAQFSENEDRTFAGAITLGGNFAQVDGDNFAGYHKASLNGGFISYAKLSEGLSLGLEILYSGKGSIAAHNQLPKRANDHVTLIDRYSIALHYTEVPVTLNFYDKHDNIFGAGFGYARLVSSIEKFNGIVDSKNYPFKKNDYNFMIHANVKAYKKLYVHMRFAYSVLSIRDNANYLTGRNKQYNNIWTIRTMYMF